MAGTVALAERSRMSALRRNRQGLSTSRCEGKAPSPEVRCLPKAIQRYCGNHLRGQPHPAAQMDDGVSSLLFIKKRDERPSATSDAQDHLQVCVVHGASNPVLHG